MKFSIITIMLNEAATLQFTLDSVQSQRGVEIEHIIVDGGSTDGSLEIAKKYARQTPYDTKIISQRHRGLYQAINEGIEASTGEIIGILHSNDRYASPDELEAVMAQITSSKREIVYGDIQYIRQNGDDTIFMRKYSARAFDAEKLRSGFCPPHPAIFMTKRLIERYGAYRTDYNIAADFEMMVRLLLANKLPSGYIPRTIAYMTSGGRSSYLSNRLWHNNREKIKALRDNGIDSNPLRLFGRYLYLLKK